jgi:hypothetical protein
VCCDDAVPGKAGGGGPWAPKGKPGTRRVVQLWPLWCLRPLKPLLVFASIAYVIGAFQSPHVHSHPCAAAQRNTHTRAHTHVPPLVRYFVWQVVIAKVQDVKEQSRRSAAESRTAISRLEDEISVFTSKVEGSEAVVEAAAKAAAAGTIVRPLAVCACPCASGV